MLMKINEIVFLSNKNNREYKTILFFMVFKGIVSRDWGGLQMILLDRYIVVNISAGGSF